MIRQWGVGDKERGGVLFLVVTKDKKISVRVSTHGEGTVTDSQAGRARDAAAPYFKQGRWGAGLNAGVDVLVARVREAAKNDALLQSPPARPVAAQPQSIGTTASGWSAMDGLLLLIPVALFIFFVCVVLRPLVRGGRGSSGGSSNDSWSSSPGPSAGMSSWDSSSSSSSSTDSGSSSWDSSPFSGASSFDTGSSSSDFGSSSDSGGSFGGDSCSGGGADGSF
jgi:uncharacterized protein